MAVYRDPNGNPIIVTTDQMMQNAYDPLAKAFRTLTGGSMAQAVTPNDTADLPRGVCKGLYIGGAGNVQIDMADGSTVTLNALAVGVIHSIAVRRVYATNTTATNIVAFY